MYDVVIIGGGASGLTTGIVAKNRDKTILILEASDRVGKKLLATGNGKCNLSNFSLKVENYNNKFVRSFLENKEKVYQFFESIGLKIKLVEDRYYPYSESSNTVLNLLRNNFTDGEIVNNCYVESIEKKDGVFVVNGNIFAKNVVLCTGSNATMGENSHFLAQKLGHHVTELKPSIAPLVTDITYIKRLANLRAKVKIDLLRDNKTVTSQSGEILFKDNGISGIAVFSLSSYIARNGGNYKISIDFAPDLTEAEIEDFLKKHSLEGLFQRLIAECIKLQADKLHLPLAYVVKRFTIENIKPSTVKNAQVTCGGLATDEFGIDLQSKLVSNLYACGEALDIDGDCGGYNLFWAFISGITVGEKIC